MKKEIMEKEHLIMKNNNDKINMKDTGYVLDILRTPKNKKRPLNQNELYFLSIKGKELEDNILKIVKKKYSDASYVTYENNFQQKTEEYKSIFNRKDLDAFYVHDFKGTIIAYIWIMDDGNLKIQPNVSTYGHRMN